MSAKIAVLPAQVADQIAAGEVVERPASVVKELVENALDAGARAIRVAIEQGGTTLIRVSDDGEGMSGPDARLALARHATSKIRFAADLIGVSTFGFRGEALPAIASVARLELETANGDGGTRLRVAGGRLEGEEPAARQRGTTVTVRGLFFNTPARRKFLRAQASETRAVVEAVTVLALARPDVLFHVTSDGRVMMDAPPADRPIDRVAALWGRAFADTLIEVSFRAGALEVRGFAQRPAQAKPTGRKAYVFVHGRPIRDPFLLRAAEAGYRSTVAPGDRPSLLLFLDLPGDAVDVNVHPAKLEVRFRDRPMIERAAEEAVRQALGSLAAAVPLGPDSWAGLDAPVAGGAPLALFPSNEDEAAETPVSGLLQLFDTYIVLGQGDAVTIVDQHSAHERVLYERAMATLKGGGGGAQRLLLPFTLELAATEQDALERHRQVLERVGYEITSFSGRSVAVHAAPNPHPRFDAARSLAELLADLGADRFGGVRDPLERFAATFACRAAIMAGQRLDPGEMRELLTALARVRLPAHDVHGRPTLVRVTRDELERRFGRR
ncbi:MAG TPA: DNA mismatch repair endonuclease MutL [Gemmatimonadales bacterium]|nr:DNA mismatch repair endonuclease MutL [Gemmatimonadales bacterium]